jgi:hypothetical protein
MCQQYNALNELHKSYSLKTTSPYKILHMAERESMYVQYLSSFTEVDKVTSLISFRFSAEAARYLLQTHILIVGMTSN